MLSSRRPLSSAARVVTGRSITSGPLPRARHSVLTSVTALSFRHVRIMFLYVVIVTLLIPKGQRIPGI